MATLKPARKQRQVVAIIAIALIVAGVGGTGIVAMSARNGPLPAFTQSAPIVNESIAVEAGSFKYYEFNVSPDIRSAGLRGSFSSTGSGSDNDIVISVVSGEALQNINEGKAYPALYFSGKVASSEINAELAERGTMYVIIDNRFSETPKVVDADVELAY